LHFELLWPEPFLATAGSGEPFILSNNPLVLLEPGMKFSRFAQETRKQLSGYFCASLFPATAIRTAVSTIAARTPTTGLRSSLAVMPGAGI